MNSLIYIHGFNSSAKGIKGQQAKELMLERGLIRQFRSPNLVLNPLGAIDQLKEIIFSLLDKPTLIGSSLGGYYATYLSEKYNLKALLINPVVLPHRLFGRSFNIDEDWHNDQLWASDAVGNILKDTYNCSQPFIDSYLKELAALEVPAPSDKERFKVWLKTGDKVLDYRFAAEWYKNCDVTIDEGGDHNFVDFGGRLSEVLVWAGLTK